jgi:chloramphenicol-sensitive protein RarD
MAAPFHRETSMSKGLGLGVAAFVLFGVIYYYSSLLKPLNGEDIFAWRMLLSVPFITAYVLAAGQWQHVAATCRRLLAQPALAGVLMLSSALLGVQVWVFMWAPLHGRALDVSLGYFILPLSLALVGRVVYREKLSPWQSAAVLAAALGVAHELWRAGGFSWPALVVCLGYPLYFMLRRRFRLEHLGGLWFDMVLLLPAAIWFALRGTLDWSLLATQTRFLWMVPLLGLLSAAALIAYILCSRLLKLAVFGLLGYIEPVLLMAVALLLGESISASAWLTWIPIRLALMLLVLEGVLTLRRAQPSH